MNKNIVKPLFALSIGVMLWAGSAGSADAYSYRVQKGDTIWTIAQKEQISTESIIKANPKINPDYMPIGQVIEVPAPAEIHVVSKGETFWKISKKLNLPLQAFLDVNPTLQPENIYEGLRLRLPMAAADDATLKQLTASSNAAAAAEPVAQTVATPAGAQKYSKVIEAKASAYTSSPEENGGWAGLDYMGNKLALGTIAVDPKVIPLGSKVYVTGYDYKGLPAGGFVGKATDTGGSIKGNRVDIFVPDSRQNAMKFGFQDIKVYILE